MKKLIDHQHLARFPDQPLIVPILSGRFPGARGRVIRRAETFFGEAVSPIERAQSTARESNCQFVPLSLVLHQRSVDLLASNQRLQQEILHRKLVEESLKKSEQHHGRLLEQSQHMQEQLRRLSRQILSAQEEERKMISRELHDEIAQTLSGVNLRLASLKSEAAVNNKGLQRKISSMQRQMEKSVDVLHQFARKLRPMALDDLGLIPALHAFIKNFARRTGVRVYLTAYPAVERLDTATRTVLFRVAQEALTNVGRHARASRVVVSIDKHRGRVCIKIKDDGKSFDLKRVLRNGGNRLGLLGMRERVEMVGGRFDIESAPGSGTTVKAQISSGNICPRGASLRCQGTPNPTFESP